MFHDFVNGIVKVSPSSQILNASKVDAYTLDWWRCDKCGSAIGKENQATHREQMTCYTCGAPRPERYDKGA